MIFNNSRSKDRFYRNLFILFALGIVIVIQLFGQFLTETFFLKLDLTENALYEFSETSREVIDSLDNPVVITVFSSEDDYIIMLKEVLQRYDKSSSKIDLRFIDPFENPVIIDRFLDKGVRVQANDIVVEGAEGFQAFTIDDMYIFNSSKTEVTGLNIEQKISATLLSVNSEIDYVAAFTDGHNERPSDSLMELFRQNSFRIARGSLSSIIAENPNIIVIASPGRDFLADEIEALDSYLNSGGSVILFLEPSLKPLVELESLLQTWGIAPGEQLVFEKDAYTGNNPINIVPMYSPHEINRFFQNTRVFITMPSSRNLEINPDRGSAYKVGPVLNSTYSSYGKTGYQFEQITREEGDSPGPFYLALSSEKELSKDQGSGIARLFVAGSSKIYGDDLLSFSSYGNSDFLVQVINWASEREDSLSIPPKNIGKAPLNIQRNQALILGALVTLLIPMIILLIGAVVYTKRKRL